MAKARAPRFGWKLQEAQTQGTRHRARGRVTRFRRRGARTPAKLQYRDNEWRNEQWHSASGASGFSPHQCRLRPVRAKAIPPREALAPPVRRACPRVKILL